MKNLKIKTKLLALVIFMLLGLIGLGIVSLVFMNQINAGSTVIAQSWMPSVIVAEELNNQTSTYRIKEYNHIVCAMCCVMKSYAA